MNKKLELLFTGCTKPRTEFLNNFRKAVSDFLQRQEYEDGELHIYLREIIKNIYDHNHGYGFCCLELLSPQKLRLVIGNSKPLSTPLKKQSSLNYQVGLSTILQAHTGEWPGIKLELTPDTPYHYTITYSF